MPVCWLTLLGILLIVKPLCVKEVLLVNKKYAKKVPPGLILVGKVPTEAMVKLLANELVANSIKAVKEMNLPILP